MTGRGRPAGRWRRSRGVGRRGSRPAPGPRPSAEAPPCRGPSRYATKRSYKRLRLEPLGDRGERNAVMDQPDRRDVPVAHVRQREDRLPCRAPRASSMCWAPSRVPLGGLGHLRRDPSSAAGTSRASSASTSAAPRRPAASSRKLGDLRTDDATQILAQLPGRRRRCAPPPRPLPARNARSDSPRGSAFTTPHPAP